MWNGICRVPNMMANTIAIFSIQVSVTEGESSTNEELTATSLGCASQMAMSWCVCQSMETSQCLGGDTRGWFRGWSGREGTCPVSGVVSVGGFVSFDSSKVLMQGCGQSSQQKTARDQTEKHRRRHTQGNARRRSREAEQRSTEKPATKYSSPCTSTERMEKTRR